jgi:lambda repressor-like predicted transcriptional regulator
MSLKIHGDTSSKPVWRAPEYIVWVGMIQRCHNPKGTGYSDYGARGIKVCARWRRSYAHFLEDAGRQPSPKHSIDRINNDGNYEPGNVRWALPAVQARNRRNNHNIEAFGRVRCVTDWATDLGANPATISGRLKRGWTPEDAVSVAADKHTDQTITLRGKTLSLLGWAKASGVSVNTIRHRLLKRGWPPEEAIFGMAGSKGLGRKPTVMLTAFGKTRSLNEWSRAIGVGRSTIDMRLARGCSPEEALAPTRNSSR